jgi:hypothetical protein
MIATALQSARSPADVIAAAARFFNHQEDQLQTLDRIGLPPHHMDLRSREDLEHCIGQVRVALDTVPMTDREEERVHRVLGYLMLASMRAEQLS